MGESPISCMTTCNWTSQLARGSTILRPISLSASAWPGATGRPKASENRLAAALGPRQRDPKAAPRYPLQTATGHRGRLTSRLRGFDRVTGAGLRPGLVRQPLGAAVELYPGVGSLVHGERMRESAETKDRGEARRHGQQRLGQIADERFVGPRADRVTFDDMARLFLCDYEVNGKKSVKDARRGVKALASDFEGRRAQSILPQDILDYIAGRQKDGLTNGLINRELAALKRMFNLALQQGRIIRKPHIPLLKENNIRQGFFEWTDFEAVRAHLPEYLLAPMTFAYFTGWRPRDEVLKLPWRNVDFEAGTVRLEPGTTKTKDGRIIYMTPQVKEVLTQSWERTKLLQRDRGQIIQLVLQNEGMPIVNYYKQWHRACRAAGVAGKIPHDFRKTAVRNMVRAGIQERVAM